MNSGGTSAGRTIGGCPGGGADRPSSRERTALGPPVGNGGRSTGTGRGALCEPPREPKTSRRDKKIRSIDKNKFRMPWIRAKDGGWEDGMELACHYSHIDIGIILRVIQGKPR